MDAWSSDNVSLATLAWSERMEDVNDRTSMGTRGIGVAVAFALVDCSVTCICVLIVDVEQRS